MRAEIRYETEAQYLLLLLLWYVTQVCGSFDRSKKTAISEARANQVSCDAICPPETFSSTRKVISKIVTVSRVFFISHHLSLSKRY